MNFVTEIVTGIYDLLTRLFCWLFKLPIVVVEMIPGSTRLASLGAKLIPMSMFSRSFDLLFSRSRSALLRGEIEAVAVSRYPKDEFPFVWQEVPDDIRRPLVVDGRLFSGEDAAQVLGPASINDGTVSDALGRSIAVGLAVAVFALLAWNPYVYFGPGKLGETKFFHAEAVTLTPAVDAWDEGKPESVEDPTLGRREAVASIKNSIVATYLRAANSSGYLTAILLGVLAAWAAFRGLLSSVMAHAVGPLSRETKESTVRWKWRLEQREMERKAYLDQIKAVAWDDQPALELGRASGVLAYRGLLSAPQTGQPVRLTLNDASQGGILVTGGTGSGKTRLVLMPMVRQLLKLRGEMIAAGNKSGLSFYVTDGKAVLWKDMLDEVIRAKQQADVKIIGTGADDYGLDLLEGLPPRVVADIVKAVMRQIKGSAGASSDDFWPDMATDLIRNVATVMYAWEATPGGLEHAEKTGERPYSLTWIYLAAMHDEILFNAIEDIQSAWQDKAAYRTLAGRADTATLDAIDYLLGPWQKMAEGTKTGILANVTNALSSFSSDPVIRERFASGAAEKILEMPKAWGSIVLTNVSSLEFGTAGTIINVFAKTLLYRAAREREMRDPKIGSREKMIFLADEFQSLVTSSGGSAGGSYDDSIFWNLSRSSGMVGVMACQSMAALEQAIGKVSAENFAHQMRNKIFLAVEDPSTIELAKKLAGKSLRSYTYKRDRYESFAALMREEGYDPTDILPYRLNSPALMTEFSLGPITSGGLRPAVDLDTRFIYRSMSNPDSGITSAQAAHWRQEDKLADYMKDGNQEVDNLRDEDLVQMGRAHAYVFIQRGGQSRQDIVELGV